MPRIYCLRQWFGHSDPGLEDALYDIPALCDFCRIGFARDAAADEIQASIFGIRWSGAA